MELLGFGKVWRECVPQTMQQYHASYQNYRRLYSEWEGSEQYHRKWPSSNSSYSISSALNLFWASTVRKTRWEIVSILNGQVPEVLSKKRACDRQVKRKHRSLDLVSYTVRRPSFHTCISPETVSSSSFFLNLLQEQPRKLIVSRKLAMGEYFQQSRRILERRSRA